MQQQQEQAELLLANNNDLDSGQKVKSRWTRSFFTALDRRHNEERYICDICLKHLASPSTLKLHRNTHVIERRYKCEPCQVSFHSQGHLQKHRRSSAHETRVEMTQAFGVPTRDNPRPYGCPECDIAFRKHGHLAKHLRSKSHITKLEANGQIPMGTYAALEKCGNLELKERMITTNCEQSLLSLRSIASTLFQGQHIEMRQPAQASQQRRTSPNGSINAAASSSSCSTSSTSTSSSACSSGRPPPPPPPQQRLVHTHQQQASAGCPPMLNGNPFAHLDALPLPPPPPPLSLQAPFQGPQAIAPAAHYTQLAPHYLVHQHQQRAAQATLDGGGGACFGPYGLAPLGSTGCQTGADGH